ncbi:MAG: PaaI family thioesterase [Coriobacteriales bacterium]|jgi:uncharacterized protein (TIGR00369 family)|nr:PaaI family thioesterase [Coriobacteriales bacterium]
MKHELEEKQVVGTQNVSNMCLVCGEGNPLSLHAQFLDLEDGSLCATFQPQPEHQSYPGRLHGGIIAAILDEVLGRVVQTRHPDVFGVTMELNVKFRAPVPLDMPVKVLARLDKLTQWISEAKGEIVLADGTVAAEGFARYKRVALEQISAGGLSHTDWHADTRAHPNSVLA